MVRQSPSDRGSQYVLGLLEALARRLRRRSALTAGAWAAAAALATTAGLVALDAAVGLPGAAYLAAAAAGAAAILAAAAAAWARRPADLYLARLVERHRPDLKNALVTFVELGAEQGADPSVRAALGRRTARVLARDPADTFLPPADWRRPAWTLGLAALALGGVLWLAQGTVVPAWLPQARAGTDSFGLNNGLSPQRTQRTQRTATDFGLNSNDNGATAASRKDAKPQRTTTDFKLNGNSNGDPTFSRDAQRSAPNGTTATAQPQGEPGAAPGGDAMTKALAADAARFDRLAQALGEPPLAAAGDGAGPPSRDPQGAAPGDGAGPPSRDPQGAAPGDGAGPPSRDPQGAAPGDASAGTGTDPGGGGRGGEAGAPPSTGANGPPLGRHPLTTDAPEDALDTMRRAQRLLEKAERAERDGDVTDAFLGRMGLTRSEFRRFVVTWQERFRAAEAGPTVTAPPHEVRTSAGTATGEVVRPSGAAEARPLVTPADPDAGEKGRLVQEAAAQVSPRLRPAVQAYFEAVGRLGGGASAPGLFEPRP